MNHANPTNPIPGSSFRLCSLALAAASALACGGGDNYVPATVSSRMYGPEMLAQGESAGVVQLARDPLGEPLPLDREQYDFIAETGFRSAAEFPLSTFSTDVDTASYSNVRRFLTYGRRPPADAVRIEELINYFSYATPEPSGDHPIAIATELTHSPFAKGHALARITLRASAPRAVEAPPRNLVFLVDVSGSMADANKLPLLKSAFELLVRQLGARDRVAIVTYAGESGVALPPTPGDDHARILSALARLGAGGSTNGAGGITTAYALARKHAQKGAVNRVILATDGDFNVGVSDRGSLVRLIEREREHGVFLTVLGFGMGNLQDATLEQLADKGNGSYAYIDTLREAHKVLAVQASATLHTIAKDAKIQVEWNPARVRRYRLIGYENRRLHDADFNDDRKDAGDLGDGHTVTALYELELHDGTAGPAPSVDPLKYQRPRALSAGAHGGELMTVKVRYKQPDGAKSRLLSTVVKDGAQPFERGSSDQRFSAAVAGFGMLLRGSPYAGAFALTDAERVAQGALGDDRDGYRREFLELVARAAALD
jgi:Ca-activated chloride channel homolog